MTGKALVSELPDIVSETIFRVSRSVEAALHQLLESGLGGGSSQRRQERVPFRRDLGIRRQAGLVDEIFGFGNRWLVEERDPQRKRIDEAVKLGIGQRTIDVAVEFGDVAV